jgi:hypothetical protein
MCDAFNGNLGNRTSPSIQEYTKISKIYTLISSPLTFITLPVWGRTLNSDPVSVRDVKDHYELCSGLKQQQNGAKDNPHVGLEPPTFYYPCRCPKSVRLEETSFLHRMTTQIITDPNYICKNLCPA